MKKDYYSILELDNKDKLLSNDEFNKKLKKNYKKLTLKYHPDRQSGKTDAEKKEAENKFKECVEAYDVLSDKNKKEQYDRFGTIDGSFSSNSSMDDILREFAKHGFGNFGFDDFDMNFSNRNRVIKGNDIRVNVTLTLDEIYKQQEKTIKYYRYKPCSHCGGTGYGKDGHIDVCSYCNGSGMVMHTERHGPMVYQTSVQCPHCNGSGKTVVNPCSHCAGTGLERQQEIFKFKIPKGVTNGIAVMVNSMGNYPQTNNATGGINGDLQLVFNIVPHKEFKIDESNPYDLYVLKEVSILDCITGCTDFVNCIDGKKYKYNINQNTEQGTVIRLRDKGLPKQDGSYGSLNIIIKHKFPKELSNDDKKLIEKLKKSKNFK